MRRASRDSQFLTEEVVVVDGMPKGGQVLGINLGWDFISEHEWGIQGINHAFGISGAPCHRTGGDLVGSEVYKVTQTPDTLKFFPDLNGHSYLMFSSMFGWTDKIEWTAKDLDSMLDLGYSPGKELATAWSGNDFGIRIKNDALGLHSMLLGQIYDALVSLDAMIFLGGQSFMGNSGLIIAIPSRVPQEELNKLASSHVNSLRLIDSAKATKIEKKLKAAGCKYYALSPRWASNDEKKKTKYPVVFWLNPEDQRNNNYGWYTVEQLRDWVKGKGPIPNRRQIDNKD